MEMPGALGRSIRDVETDMVAGMNETDELGCWMKNWKSG